VRARVYERAREIGKRCLACLLGLLGLRVIRVKGY